MRFELNEVEARLERYPSTISFLNLLNSLIAQEKDVGDRGQRYSLTYHFFEINRLDIMFDLFPSQVSLDI